MVEGSWGLYWSSAKLFDRSGVIKEFGSVVAKGVEGVEAVVDELLVVEVDGVTGLQPRHQLAANDVGRLFKLFEFEFIGRCFRNSFYWKPSDWHLDFFGLCAVFGFGLFGLFVVSEALLFPHAAGVVAEAGFLERDVFDLFILLHDFRGQGEGEEELCLDITFCDFEEGVEALDLETRCHGQTRLVALHFSVRLP